MDSSEAGYVNYHGQVNLGWLERGCHRMHCLYCGQTYGTMTGVSVRRCPTPDCPSQWNSRWGDPGPTLTPEERPASWYERRAQAVEALAKSSRQ